MSDLNRQVWLVSRPAAWPSEENFRLVESPMPQPAEGQMLVQVLYTSVDPYLRGRMRERASYIEPIPLDSVMQASSVGRIVVSRNPKFAEGDYVGGMLGWQDYAVAGEREVRKLDPGLAPITTALGILGMPGLTSYFGITEILHAKEGETLLVSGAAGAVGSVAGQIGKLLGLHVAGIAGSDDKIRWLLDELHFDAAYNYKTETDHKARIAALCPKGVDCYFDNVGGVISDAAFLNVNERARIAVCGQISQYNNDQPEMGPRLQFQFIVKRARMEGFLVFDFAKKHPEALAQMTEWFRAGKLINRETVVEGLENTPNAFIGMLKGENIGKMIVRIAAE
ncbi:MAG: NADP-dependent oxidoreductase [Acidobacteriota bacterium]